MHAHRRVTEPVQLAYVLYVDVVVLNYDGNVTDACFIAVNAALRSGL